MACFKALFSFGNVQAVTDFLCRLNRQVISIITFSKPSAGRSKNVDEKSNSACCFKTTSAFQPAGLSYQPLAWKRFVPERKQ